MGRKRRTTSDALQASKSLRKKPPPSDSCLPLSEQRVYQTVDAHARLWQGSCCVVEAMNPGYVAALAGAALGGFTSFASSWTTLHAQMKAQRLASSRSSRQELYKQFIEEASRTYVDALVHDKLDVSGLVGIYSLISKMRVLSSQKVIESAARIAILITDTYFQPNKTPTELQAMMHDGGVDPLLDFSDVCRQELETDRLA
jgi:hypothetical protein